MSADLAVADTLWALLARRAAMTPDATMLLDAEGRAFTFAEVQDWSERFAAGLADRGLGPGSVVAWQLPTRIEAAVVQLALARLGVTQVAIIHLYRTREVRFLLGETRADLFIVPGTWRGFDFGTFAHAIQEEQVHPHEVLVLDELMPDGDPATLPTPPDDPDDVRYIYSTSGTTANPKAVRHTDASLIAAASSFADALGLRTDDVNAICFPFGHIGGPIHLIAGLRYGFPCLYVDAFSIPDSLDSFREAGVTITGGSNAHFLMLLEEQRKQPGRRLLPTLRMLYGGGAAKPPEIYWRAKAELDVVIQYAFGLTEAPVVSCCTPTDTDEQRAFTDGAPLPAGEVKIVDADGLTVPTGAEGEVVVRGPMVARGYTVDELTSEAFDDDGFLRTGDRGRRRDDGMLVITGRSKDVIIRKGENLSAREIEDVLTAHPKVSAVAVIGLADEQRGERVCAVVECRPDAEPFTVDEMIAACRAADLMVQKWPEQLEVVDQLPRNATLKIDKQELRARFAAGPALPRSTPTPGEE